jgi:hypothetical protein
MADSDSNTNAALVNTVPDAHAIATLREALLAIPMPEVIDDIMRPDPLALNDHEAARAAYLATALPEWASHIQERKAARPSTAGASRFFDESAPRRIEPGQWGATAAQAAQINQTLLDMDAQFAEQEDTRLNRSFQRHHKACTEEIIDSGILPRNKASLYHTYIALDATVPEHVKAAVYEVLADLLVDEATSLIAEYQLPRPSLFCVQCSKRRADFDWGTCCSEECWTRYRSKRKEALGENSTREYDTWSPHTSDGQMCRYCSMFYERTEPVEDHRLCGPICMAYLVAKDLSWRFDHEIIDVAQYIGRTWSKAIGWPAVTSAQARLAYNRAVRLEEQPEPLELRRVRDITPAASRAMADRILAAAPPQPNVVSEAELRQRARVRPTEAMEYVRERDRLIREGRLGRRGRGTRGSGFMFWAQ